MNKILKIKVLDFIYDLLKKFGIGKKFDKQIIKLELGFFDKSLNFEKIECKKGFIFYSFRIDIHYRAYLRKENDVFIVFDINNHDYESIKNKLKSM
ncbi:MAG: hypothetical protein PHF46_02025 [Candidatus Gracilibacteria bacterium]|nr:hypothetical protein [Candidatus Gracilibacteria bacterium]MDD3120162.1 hypothetical protein [Candidatus Gracilibacteria bacterium]MDD4530260.1 hypothetical protein [Candidatus Gracilibacteria bacterium]